jgi:tetratricopeptide (TPR) repeat protein
LIHINAVFYKNQANYVEAEGLFKRALAIQEKNLGANQPDVAFVLYSLANVFMEQGKYAEAEGLYNRALAIREKVKFLLESSAL